MTVRETAGDHLPQPLTSREVEVLHCIGEGLTNRQIAAELTIALSTVKWYIRQIYNKLGAFDRAQAITRARALGLLPEAAQAIRHNLPLAVTPFVGREQELLQLDRLLADPQVDIITLAGPGGMGKTRLALEAANRQLGSHTLFADGIYLVSLAPVESADEIVSTLAATLDFHFRDAGVATRSELEQLLSFLERKRMLLVMDNFEHVLDGRSLLAQIRSHAAGIKFLVTSREHLQLHGEQIFPLQGLAMPQPGETREETLAASPAIQLFLNISRRVTPDFELLAGDTAQLLRICALVEGMPLGLELAASWVGLLPLSAIAAEIEQNIHLLSSEYYDVPPRHRSMQAALDASWQRLNPEQKRAFQELTVFRGGFTRAAALEIAGASLPLLVTLANKSWLTYDRQSDRYAIHELLRQYGAAKLSADADHQYQARAAHSAYFCAYLQARETDWLGARQQEATAEVKAEIDNIQRAWRWAADQGNGALLAQGLNGLCRFYFWEGRLKDGQQACHSAVEGVSRRLAESEAMDLTCQAVWASALAGESVFVDDVAQKKELLTQAQALLDGVPPGSLDTRRQRAFLYLAKAYAAENWDFAEAIHFAHQALPLFQELGHRWGEAEVMALMGGDAIFQGDYARADELLRSSLAIRQELGDKQGVAESTVYLGLIARHQGRFEEAEALDRQSLKLYRALGNPFREAWCLGIHAYTLIWAGKFARAQQAAERAIALDRDLGQYPNPWSLNPLSKALNHLGQTAEAKNHSLACLDLARHSGQMDQASWALLHLGNIALIEGDLDSAAHYLLESAATLASLQHIFEAIPRACLSYVYRAQGDEDTACVTLVDALRASRECQSISPLICCLPAAALLTADRGQLERAVEIDALAQQFGHINNSTWFTGVAGSELEGVRAALPPEAAESAEARGRDLDVWQTAEALLDELA